MQTSNMRAVLDSFAGDEGVGELIDAARAELDAIDFYFATPSTVEKRVADIEAAVRALGTGGIQGAIDLVRFVDTERDKARLERP